MPKSRSDPSPVALYQTPDGKVTVNVLFARDNFWLTQRTMSELFGVKVPAVNKHLKNIFIGRNGVAFFKIAAFAQSLEILIRRWAALH
jgi:hypothetical protein